MSMTTVQDRTLFTVYQMSERLSIATHEHMINVFEDVGEITTLMTANKGIICDKATDLLKNGFIIKKDPSLKGLDAVVEAAQRLKFLAPTFSGTLGTDEGDKEPGITATRTDSPPVTGDR